MSADRKQIPLMSPAQTCDMLINQINDVAAAKYAGLNDLATSKYAEVVTTSMSSVSTVVNVASFALAFMGILIALVAFFGWKACIGLVEKKSDKKLNDYIGSDEFKAIAEKKIESFVREMSQANIALVITRQSDGRGTNGGENFPPPPSRPRGENHDPQ